MAHKTLEVMWTALPNGLTDDGSAYRVSVLVSPRLILAAGLPQRLDQFPDMLDWPQVLAGARIGFEFGAPGTTIGATLVSQPRSADWTAVFPPDTFVRSRVFE